MPTMYVYEFKVRSTPGNPFPLDMLRYDHCFPDTEQDAGTIHHTLDRRSVWPEDQKYVDVTLRCYGSKEKKFTHGRWESFGWKVLEIYNRKL